MIHNRRFFIQKLSLVFGAVVIPDYSIANHFFKVKNNASYVVQIDGKPISRYQLNSINHPNFNISRSLKLSTGPINTLSDQIGRSQLAPDAMLFKGEMLQNLPLDQLEKLGNAIPMINSNFQLKDEYSDLIKDHLIIESFGKKIGIMGISFGESGQKIPETILTMNQKASYLKGVINCDEVYCLTEDPELIFPFFKLRDLAENSMEITHFFTSCPNIPRSKLMVLANSEKRETLLNIHSLKDPKPSFVAFKNGSFSEYNSL
jgi:hypothetical protein